MEDDTPSGISNVVKGPWKRAKVIPQSETDRVTEDMALIDEIAESIMIPTIHNLSENGVDIKDEEFLSEIGFLNEVIKSIMYRTMKYPHPMTPLIDTVMSTKKESIEDVYSKFNFEKIDEMLDNLNKDDKKEDE